MKIYILDFEDSFTYNIAADLKEIGLDSLVVHWSKSTSLSILSGDVVILGPGPGHPNEYAEIKSFVIDCLNRNDIFMMGICLGHQLIGQCLNGELYRRERPLHGQSIEFRGPYSKNVHVQLYNSLAIRPRIDHKLLLEQYECDGMSMMLVGKNFVSYQFHPESVGTSCHFQFFDPIASFIYNK